MANFKAASVPISDLVWTCLGFHRFLERCVQTSYVQVCERKFLANFIELSSGPVKTELLNDQHCLGSLLKSSGPDIELDLRTTTFVLQFLQTRPNFYRTR